MISQLDIQRRQPSPSPRGLGGREALGQRCEALHQGAGLARARAWGEGAWWLQSTNLNKSYTTLNIDMLGKNKHNIHNT